MTFKSIKPIATFNILMNNVINRIKYGCIKFNSVFLSYWNYNNLISLFDQSKKTKKKSLPEIGCQENCISFHGQKLVRNIWERFCF